MTMTARPSGSLCTHGPILPDCQSAWALSHSLSGDNVRNMQENCCLRIPVQASYHLERSGACICAEKKKMLGVGVSVLCVFVRVAV